MIDLTHIAFEGVETPWGRSRRSAGSGGHLRSPASDPARSPTLADWVLAQAGLDPTAYRPSALERRVPACLRRLRAPSPEAARELLGRRPALVSALLDSILIGVTEFFRDPMVFQQLHLLAVPELSRARTTIRCCSLGASAGQELVSFAILLAESGLIDRAELVGVDCRPEAVAAARAGIYGADEMEGMPPYLRDNYFEPVGDGRWSVCRRLAARCRWRESDLLAVGAEVWDVVLFRNVAIYLDPVRADAVWETLFRQLSPGGFLVTGKAERPSSDLPLRRLARCIYRKSDRPCPCEN